MFLLLMHPKRKLPGSFEVVGGVVRHADVPTPSEPHGWFVENLDANGQGFRIYTLNGDTAVAWADAREVARELIPDHLLMISNFEE